MRKTDQQPRAERSKSRVGTRAAIVGITTLVGFDGAALVLAMLKAGASEEKIKKALRPFITRHVNTPEDERRAQAQEVRRIARKGAR